jgi:hypothetical protein
MTFVKCEKKLYNIILMEKENQPLTIEELLMYTF